MRNTIKLKMQIAIAVVIAVVSGVQAWISVNQLQQETTSALNSEMANINHKWSCSFLHYVCLVAIMFTGPKA